jgi:hypothetical protein
MHDPFTLAGGLATRRAASERVFSTDDMLAGSTAFLEERPAFRNR